MENLDFLSALTETGLNPIDYQYFHQLFDNRTILMNSEIDESVIEKVYLPLRNFERDNVNEKVTLILNSIGGSILDSLFLCNLIDNYSKPLDIIVPAYACSMGTIILCAGNNNPNVTKYCYPFSFGLFHSGQTAIAGESSSVEDIVLFNKKTDERIRDYIISHTNISLETYNEHNRKQWYLNADDMKKYGLIDIIMGESQDIGRDE